MKHNTLIVVYGREGAGKSPGIVGTYKKLSGEDPVMKNKNDMRRDWVVLSDEKKIGFASEGDPKSGQKSDIKFLMDHECNIILCACRATFTTHRNGSQETVNNIYDLASTYGYEIIWIHNYELDGLNRQHDEAKMNDAFADAMIDLIHRL